MSVQASWLLKLCATVASMSAEMATSGSMADSSAKCAASIPWAICVAANQE